MISRRTTNLLSDVMVGSFRKYNTPPGGRGTASNYYTPDTESLYDFLYDRDYDMWFCNLAKKQRASYGTRILKDFIMQLHTGEAIVTNTKGWDWQQREKLGQRLLENLSADILTYSASHKEDYTFKAIARNVAQLQDSLALDGYEYKNERLLVSEADVLDVAEETGVLQALYTSLALARKDTAFHHLQLSEEHYIAQKWDDSISNSRKFLECVLQEVASSHGKAKGVPLPEATYTRPVQVRDYLEREQLLDKKEKEALASVYGLLSQTGGHPYMAENDQARLLRHLALTFSQFVMLRLKGQSSAST